MTSRRSDTRWLVWPGAFLALLALGSVSASPFAQTPIETPTAASAPPRASRDWKQLQSTHFVVVGNSTAGVLRDTTIQLEMFRDTVSRLFPALREPPPRPTTVVVFRNDASFHEFKPRDPRGRVMDTVAGYLTTYPDANYIVLAARTNPTQTVRVVLHEFAHYLIHGAAPEVPRWLDEGLADFYSTILIDPNGSVRLGDPIRGHLARLRGGLIVPLDRLLSAPGQTTIFGDMRQQLTFYAQSWGLVHYLTLGHAGRRDGQMEAYLRAIEAGQSLADAGRHAFGGDLRQLHIELATYMRRPILPTQSLTRPSTDGPMVGHRPVPMLEADVQALRASLLSRVPVFRDAGTGLPPVVVEPRPLPPSARLP